jgi:hypothetical protein
VALLGAEVTFESACKFGHILHILRILFVMQIGDLCGIQVMTNVRPSSKLRWYSLMDDYIFKAAAWYSLTVEGDLKAYIDGLRLTLTGYLG